MFFVSSNSQYNPDTEVNYELEPVIPHLPIVALKSTNENILSESMQRSRRHSCKRHRWRIVTQDRSIRTFCSCGSREQELAIKCSGVPFSGILALLAISFRNQSYIRRHQGRRAVEKHQGVSHDGFGHAFKRLYGIALESYHVTSVWHPFIIRSIIWVVQ